MERIVVVVEGATVERVREVAVREGWRMPLAPFVANDRAVRLVGVLAEAG